MKKNTKRTAYLNLLEGLCPMFRVKSLELCPSPGTRLARFAIAAFFVEQRRAIANLERGA